MGQIVVQYLCNNYPHFELKRLIFNTNVSNKKCGNYCALQNF